MHGPMKCEVLCMRCIIVHDCGFKLCHLVLQLLVCCVFNNFLYTSAKFGNSPHLKYTKILIHANSC